MSTCTPTITQRPRYNISEEDSHLTLQIALPGAAKENVELQTEANLLRLQAERPSLHQQGWNLISGEEQADQYALELRINPQYDLSKAEASFDNNVLQLSIPTKETSERTLEIQ